MFSPRLLLAFGVGGVLAMFAPLAPSLAHAQYSGCRSDPIVVLSDGTIMDLTSTIGATPAGISAVSYVVHAPTGVTISRIVYTNGPLANLESATLVNNAAPGHYEGDVTVTGSQSSSVTLYVAAWENTGLEFGQQSGLTNQTLTVAL